MKPCALVAGAGRGIGRAVACALAREGVLLALAARTVAELEETRSLAGGDALVLPGDVSRPDDVARIIAEAERELGGIDVLVDAAAIHGAIGPVSETDPAAWLRALEVDLFGAYLLCRAVVPGMVARGAGRIVLFAGGGATSPRPGFSAYAAAKAGVVRLAETLAEELQPNVQVNAVAPGVVDTALLDDVLEAGARAGAELAHVRAIREGRGDSVPAELAAELVAYLALHAPAELTGRLLSAPHDPWREWAETGEVPSPGLYTLRRFDPHTLDAFAGARR